MDQSTSDSVASYREQSIDWDRNRLELWRSFCQRYRIGENSVPLFECDESGFVLNKEIGTARRRKILQRSSAMEALMRQEGRKVIDDYKAATGLYDGIIYMMHTRGNDGGVVPCYIGKAETIRKDFRGPVSESHETGDRHLQIWTLGRQLRVSYWRFEFRSSSWS